jgi:hypothetical protein
MLTNILRAGFAVDQGCLAMLGVGSLPTIENLSGDAKVAARPGDIAAFFGVL